MSTSNIPLGQKLKQLTDDAIAFVESNKQKIFETKIKPAITELFENTARERNYYMKIKLLPNSELSAVSTTNSIINISEEFENNVLEWMASEEIRHVFNHESDDYDYEFIWD
jgi:hypothetical protein